MTPELSILKLLLNYEQWCSCKGKLSIEDFPKDLQGIFSCIDNYHASHPDTIELSGADLANLVFSTPHKDKEYVAKIVEQVDQIIANEKTTHQLINAIREGKLLKQLSLSSYEVAEGRLDREKFLDQLEQYQSLLTQTDGVEEVESDFLENDLEAIVSKVVSSPGLVWRLNTMNKMLGSLRKGNFGFIFARPETGKTTFLASEVTFMAEQLKEEDGPIIWFNNEQVGEEVLLRLYQSSLGRDTAALLSNIPQAQQEYLQRTHNKLRLIDRSQIHRKYVEDVCDRYKPSLVVIDQMDAIHGFDADRKDLQLGDIYRWGRELAKKHCPVIAVCQADGSGEGVRWLTMSNVADAKTAKQAHPDWIMGVGKVNDVGYEQLRFLHLSKNKLHGDTGITDPNLRHGRMEVLIDATIGRYKDIH